MLELSAVTLPPGQTILFDYRAQAGLQSPVTASGSFPAIQPGPDLTLAGPDGPPLFEVEFFPGSLTITALRTFTDSAALDFRWAFTLPATSQLAFSSATLRSSTLFSIPPFTFAVEPTVVFDPTTRTITISRFIAAGVGTAQVNGGGSAVVDFTVVPEPSAATFFALLGIPFLLCVRLRRSTGRGRTAFL